ncbi:2-methylisocitrate lyase-like PEP mutase family enzyme [Tumebacillus sp. BK434]|uniref:isocitrate lyase/PEP mutase family protein n=1 Tax=Tumebacillus sp. BK434 TaxID=2512169 RepID=UPI00104F7FB6|nr:isocitrate lyase/phosphoenolpyruvate mutase family protein [Tumebacillus sp. BK434]TCP58105.1 2-methylisocitrate lyase-like PEP mutase family enzyme [Tumebacillus sp. BK434]
MNNIQRFHDLHTGSDLLFLGNAWDLLSALALEKAGFPAIGTTSWGIANSLGRQDSEQIRFADNLAVVKQIVEHVKIPVTADLEAGYSEDPQEIVANVLQAAEAGVAGINLEDSWKQEPGLREITAHSALLHNIRTALDQNGYFGFYLNARIDTYLQKPDPLAETILRAQAYAAAGASGVFVPGLQDEDDIRAVAAAVDVPLNLLSLPELTDCQRLQELGVKRLSFGNAFSDKVILYMEACSSALFESRNTALLYR